MIQHRMADLAEVFGVTRVSVFGWAKEVLEIKTKETKRNAPSGFIIEVNQVDATILSMFNLLRENGYSTFEIKKRLGETFKNLSKSIESIRYLNDLNLVIGKKFILICGTPLGIMEKNLEMQAFSFREAHLKILNCGFETD